MLTKCVLSFNLVELVSEYLVSSLDVVDSGSIVEAVLLLTIEAFVVVVTLSFVVGVVELFGAVIIEVIVVTVVVLIG